MTENELAERIDYIVDQDVSYIRDRIAEMSFDKKNYGNLEALYAEYRELLNDNEEEEIVTIHGETGEVNEYLLVAEDGN